MYLLASKSLVKTSTEIEGSQYLERKVDRQEFDSGHMGIIPIHRSLIQLVIGRRWTGIKER